MSQAITQVVEGWSGPLQYRLDTDGSPKDLTGLTIIPLVENKYGAVISSSSDLSVDSASGGIVSWNPLSTDTLKAAHEPYILQFLLYDGADDLGVFPSEAPIQIRVRPLGYL